MKYILLVEDDPFLIDIYSTKFKEVGFEVRVAKDGPSALKLIEERTPDLLILDIIVPHLDGWEILAKVKSQDKFKKLAVLILSNLGQRQEVEKGLKLGAAKYLIKAHYTPSEIVEEARKMIK